MRFRNAVRTIVCAAITLSLAAVFGVSAWGGESAGVRDHHVSAARWWNTLDAGQMAAALYGESVTEGERKAAARPYGELDRETKDKVDQVAAQLYGDGGHASVGAWWESLDCRLMRVAAGDGTKADSSSAFCAHYPGSGEEKILDERSKNWLDAIGRALLGREDVGAFPL